ALGGLRAASRRGALGVRHRGEGAGAGQQRGQPRRFDHITSPYVVRARPLAVVGRRATARLAFPSCTVLAAPRPCEAPYGKGGWHASMVDAISAGRVPGTIGCNSPYSKKLF